MYRSSPAKRGKEATDLVRSLKGVADDGLLDAVKMSLRNYRPGVTQLQR